MLHDQSEFQIQTPGPAAIDITDRLRSFVAASGIGLGLLTVFVRHTSASLMIQENYDPDVLVDMESFLRRLVVPGDPLFTHTSEGPDDMPAHIRTALTHTSVSIPVREGKLQLGTWQGIYLYEHRDRPHRRSVIAHIAGTQEDCA